jgi:hypothetical protein
MDEFEDIHATARGWYRLKMTKGEQPRVYVGGMLDGLLYYPINLDGVDYWLTDVGLFDPPPDESSSGAIDEA